MSLNDIKDCVTWMLGYEWIWFKIKLDDLEAKGDSIGGPFGTLSFGPIVRRMI